MPSTTSNVRKLFLRGLVSALIFVTNLQARADAPEVVAQGFGFVEGTIFVGDDLWFVDYDSSRVLRIRNGQVQTVWQENGCGANGLVQVGATVFVACYNNGTVAKISTDGGLLQRIRQDRDGHPFVAPNDLAVDTKGGVYFSASGSGDGVLGKVFYLRPDGAVLDVADGIRDANGLVVARDGKTLYLAGTAEQRLMTFAIAPDGTLGASKPFVDLAATLGGDGVGRHTPDGVRMDRNGNIFVGLFEGGGFVVLDPMGRLLKTVDLPGAYHANLAISPDGKSIYATAVFVGPDGRARGEILRVANPIPK
jgi:gluconolactonase